jgi:hypothetical protein
MVRKAVGDAKPTPGSKDTRGRSQRRESPQASRMSPQRERDQRASQNAAGPCWGDDDDVDALIRGAGSPR